MAYIPDQQQNTGSFIPSTQIWDINEIYQASLDPKMEELFVRLYQNLGLMADNLNKKDFAFYLNEELVNGQRFYNPVTSTAGFYVLNDEMSLRPDFRKVINFGPIAAGANTQPHGLVIGATWKFTRIYATGNDNIGFNYYPIPWASSGGATNIELKVNATNIVITNNSGVAFTSCDVILEYLKY